MARAQVSSFTYDVFLSFRGDDTRSGFTKYLHDALIEKGITAFMDAENLSKGEEINDVLVKAIEGSKIAIVVFSERYASSTWCLDELLRILECKNRKGQLVIPVFYKVEPTTVRKQKDSYAKHMAFHERTLRHDIEKVERWREALFKAASISGWDTKNHPFERDLINAIVEHVFNTLPTAQGYGFNNDVAKEKRVSDGYQKWSDHLITTEVTRDGRGKAIAIDDDDMIEELYGLKRGEVIDIHSAGELGKMLGAVSKTSGLAILYFTAKWCVPSVSMSSLFTSLAMEYPKVVFLKIDVNEAEDVADRWKIDMVPSFLFLKNGKKVEEFAGSSPETLKWQTADHAARGSRSIKS